VEVVRTSLPDAVALAPSAERLAFLAMVADGVGGGRGGEQASRMAVAAITRYVAESINAYYTADSTDGDALTGALHAAALHTHTDLLEAADLDPEVGRRATTLTLFIGVWPHIYLLQVGDSRHYVLRDGELRQTTRDQTLGQELMDSGVLDGAQVARLRWADALSSTIGGSETTPVVNRLDSGWGHVHLICSDGLTRHVSDARIHERLVAMTSAKQVCEDLLKDALDDGGTDNVTLIVGRAVRKGD
jgi:protein phosphatase